MSPSFENLTVPPTCRMKYCRLTFRVIRSATASGLGLLLTVLIPTVSSRS